MSAPSGTVQVVLAAGGTGGHLFPAEALAEALLGRGVGVALLTDRRGADFTGALGRIETRDVPAAGIAGRGVRGKLASLFLLAKGTLQARRRLRHWRPDVVVGFGGYPSVPTVLAAQLLGIDTVIHEQNALIGRANRLLMGRAKRIATSFAEVDCLPERLADRVVVTGNPVRPAFQAARNAPYPAEDGAIRLLVLGGSQGASAFATLIPQAVEALPAEIRRRLEITQQCRADDLEKVRARYEAMDIPATLAAFITDVPDRLAASHLLIARAGASTVAEVTTVGRPAIFVPYPHATDDHQTANAEHVAAAGAALVCQERDAQRSEGLAARLRDRLADANWLTEAAARARALGIPDAADRLADVVTGLKPAEMEAAA